MTARRWWWRAALPLAVAGGVLVGGSYAHLDPEPVRVVLLAAVLALGLGVLLDSTVGEPATWGEQRFRLTRPRGRDAATAGHLRLVEDHLAARSPGPALRQRLARLAEQALVRRGVDPASPAARELLGAELLDILEGPVRRLSRADVERCLTRIEQL